jgi:hypothetical protein
MLRILGNSTNVLAVRDTPEITSRFPPKLEVISQAFQGQKKIEFSKKPPYDNLSSG